MKCIRIFPEMCASTLCLFSNSTRNMALGSDSTTVPSMTIVSSFGLGRWTSWRTASLGRAAGAAQDAELFSIPESPPCPAGGACWRLRRPGRGIKLKVGHVLAVEPMVNMGGRETAMYDDGWTVVTADGSLSAHFEHTIAVTEDGPEVLTVLD